MKVKFYCDGEFKPVVASDGAAGIDLYNNGDDVVIKMGEVKDIKTATYFEIPEGYVGLLFIRGGHGQKGFQLTNSVGVVDADYRGEVGASIFINSDRYMKSIGKDELVIQRGERFCQMVIMPYLHSNLLEIDSLDDFSETSRGSGRYNSTGIK